MRPAISFVVIAYNVENTIERCLRSLAIQTFRDIEIVVVDDGSLDGTRGAIERVMAHDSRFRLLSKDHNEGAHLARKSGALAAEGSYVIFVDGDDELVETAAEVLFGFSREREFDILRFGRSVIPSGNETAEQAAQSERIFNTSIEYASRRCDLLSVFSDSSQRCGTWSIIDCMFPGPFVRSCFEVMTSARLGRMQDAYEMLVILSRASRYLAFTEYRALRYHFGAGVSGYGRQSLERFLVGSAGMGMSCQAAVDYASESGEKSLVQAAQWLRNNVLSTVANEWCVRLAPDDQVTAFHELRRRWGDDTVALMLLGPLNARISWLFGANDPTVFSHDDDFMRWDALFSVLESVDSSGDSRLLDALTTYRLAKERVAETLASLNDDLAVPASAEACPGIFGRVLHMLSSLSRRREGA